MSNPAMRLRWGMVLAVACVLMAGCAADRAYKRGVEAFEEGRLEEALQAFDESAAAAPGTAQYRAAPRTYRSRALDGLWRSAQAEREAGRLDDAEKTLRRMLGIEPGHDRATEALDQIVKLRRLHAGMASARTALQAGNPAPAQKLLADASIEGVSSRELNALKQEVADVLSARGPTDLNLLPAYAKPVSLDFRNASVTAVLEALTRATGVNFIFDRDMRPEQRTTVMLNNTPVEEALDFILQTNRLEKKVLNARTVLIYPNTPEKLKEYQDLLVRSFYLGRADVKQVQANLKTLLNLKNSVIDEKLNLLIVRDTPETLRLVERIVAMQDIFEPEVMLEVEVMEVNRNRLLELGVKFPSQLSLTPLASGGGSSLTLADLKNLNDSTIGASIGSATINLRRDVSDVNVLANPRIRARNREKAKVLIGDKVPVITTTTTSTGFVSESVQYLDVGLKLEVEPNIFLKNEVAIKIGLEVSSLVKEVRSSTGALTYQVGTRGASTLLQLRDGETQILAGLINEDERSSAARVPGLGDLPLIGRLFSSQRDEKQQTEIVLAITPRIVRTLDRPEPYESSFWSGSEAYPRAAPLRLSTALGEDKPASAAPSAPSSPSSPRPAGAASAAQGPASTPAPASAATMTAPKEVALSWNAPAQIKRGDTVEVELILKSDGGVKSLPLQIAYTRDTLQLLEVKPGPYFRQADTPENQVVFSHSIDAGAGRAFVSLGRTASDGLRGEAAVVSLKFRALADTPKAQIELLSASLISAAQQNVPVPLPAPLALRVEP